MLEAIGEIESYVAALDFGAFRGDFRTIRAVELNLVIIGEAATHVPGEIQSAHSEIPWSRIKALRNRLVHAYFDVDPRILWDTVENELPALRLALEQLLLAR